MNLPEKYLENMRELLGDEFDAYLESFDEPRVYGLRVNTKKISVEDFLKISPFELTPIPWISNGFYYREEDRPAKHPYYYAGLYYIQEPSAMTPAEILPIEEGDVVADLCAAPGGKSTELASKLNGSGMLLSNDISATRAKALLRNLEGFGIGNMTITSEDPTHLREQFGEVFDKILVDAPCSGEGMFRKDNKLIRAWDEEKPAFFANIQRSIIVNAADMLKPGGMMLYSTCTFNHLEDEESIEFLLKERPEMSLVNIANPYKGFATGFTTTEDDKSYHLERAVRIFPHKMRGEGHFLALLKKDGERFASGTAVKPSEKLPEELTEFLKELKMPFDPERITIRDSKVYLMPEHALSMHGLRILRSGLLLGELKKKRFEPSQALAMALKSSDYTAVIDLPVSDVRVTKYLKGETLNVADFNVRDGFCLVCVDGFPLGWGKKGKSNLKNKYLPGWRMQ